VNHPAAVRGGRARGRRGAGRGAPRGTAFEQVYGDRFFDYPTATPARRSSSAACAATGWWTYIAAAEEALADHGEPWEAFVRFMRRIVDADTHSLTSRLAGTFTPTDELSRDAATAQELNERLVERTRAAGAIRDDLDVNDLSMVFEQLASIRLGDEDRTHQLRHRYLALLLEAMRGPSSSPLPGPPPTWQEITARW
jgi:hypothetical protein